jgi:hypothetical protein
MTKIALMARFHPADNRGFKSESRGVESFMCLSHSSRRCSHGARGLPNAISLAKFAKRAKSN